MNPADEVPRMFGNHDRREPPERAITDLMARLDERLKREEKDSQHILEVLAEVQAEQSAAREERSRMRIEMQPLTEALQQARAVRWVLAGLVAAVAALAASYGWLKAHVVMAFKVTLLVVLLASVAVASSG